MQVVSLRAIEVRNWLQIEAFNVIKVFVITRI